MSSIDRRKFIWSSAAAGLASLAWPREGMGLLMEEDGFPGPRRDALRPIPWPHDDYAVRAVPLERVNITDGFWTPRMEANRKVSLGYCFEKFEGDGGFSVSKLIEAAAYMLAKEPDPELEAYVDQRIQGLLGSLDRRIRTPEQTVRVSGHFLEAAVAYFRVTGKRPALDAAIGIADRMDEAYGPGKLTHISGHEGLKIGLISLYRLTGDEKYWRLAKFFADERGKEDYERTGEYALDRTYAQDHAPVVEQSEAVGHCVRATFLYIPMTDIAALAGSQPYRDAVDRIWDDAVLHKTYLTGGIGSVRFHEQYGEAYELPNLSAWNETCAAYGNVIWNHRLFLLKRDARYIDVMERVLYNALLVGVSLEGDRFFYQNPLKSFGDYERFEWINVPCCPPNVVRMVASVGEYIYASDDAHDLFLNLFVDSQVQVEMGGNPVTLRQETRYPWDGRVRVTLDMQSDTDFALHLRIPGWALGSVLPGDLYSFSDEARDRPTVLLNGREQALELENGYLVLDRSWRAGDVVELDLPMPVRQVVAHPDVEDDRGRVALQRGPLVYCAEWPDNGGRALNLVVPADAELESSFRSDLLSGVQVVEGRIRSLAENQDGDIAGEVPHQLRAIPYYAWANRGMGEMAVWLARDPSRAWLPPQLPQGVAGIRTSGGVEKGWTGYNDQNDDLGSVYDGREPLNSADQSHRFFRMRPPVGQAAWLEFEFTVPTNISRSRVYWFDDKRFCKLPESWRIVVLQAGEWIPVTSPGSTTVEKDAFSSVEFDPVTTTAVRLEVEPRTVHYRAGEIGPPAAMFIDQDIDWREFGIIEWEVE